MESLPRLSGGRVFRNSPVGCFSTGASPLSGVKSRLCGAKSMTNNLPLLSVLGAVFLSQMGKFEG